jgi:uncharacterized membrane protein YvlD (DUF360 family)
LLGILNAFLRPILLLLAAPLIIPHPWNFSFSWLTPSCS